MGRGGYRLDPRPADATASIDRGLLLYSPTPVSDAFSWEEGLTFDRSAGKRSDINETIQTNDDRTRLLKALGMGTAPIDVDDTVADDLLQMPRIETEVSS